MAKTISQENSGMSIPTDNGLAATVVKTDVSGLTAALSQVTVGPPIGESGKR